MYTAIVFLPLIGALIVGFFGRFLGDKASGVPHQHAPDHRHGSSPGLPSTASAF